MATPTIQIDRLINSDRAIASPKKRKAMIVAKIGEVLLRKATFDREINFTAVLKMKKVIVPDIARTITSFH